MNILLDLKHIQFLTISMLAFLSPLYKNAFSRGHCSKYLLFLPLHTAPILSSDNNTSILLLENHFLSNSPSIRFTWAAHLTQE